MLGMVVNCLAEALRGSKAVLVQLTLYSEI